MRFSPRFFPLPLLAAGLAVVACGDDASSGRVPAAQAPPGTGDRVRAVVPAAEAPDVTVAGRVLDDETGEGVAGGYVIVLAPGVSFTDWEQSPDEDVESLMAGAAVTDSLGQFEVADLPRGSDFTVVVAARGHAPAVFESGLTVKPDDPPITRLADVRLEPR